MKLRNVEKTETNTSVLTIEVTKEEFDKGLDQAYRKNRHEITVPGFRKGKAPRKVIEAAYGTSIFYEDGINYTYPQAYAEAVVEANLEPVDQPAVDLVEFTEEGGYVFTATITTYPEVTLGEYKGLKAERNVAEVTDADVDEQLKNLQERNARIQTVEREAREGDAVVIDFDGYVDGERFENGKAENYTLELGSHTFIDTFEDQLVGAKAGDEKDVNVTFPDPYQSPELSGKAATFKVKVHEVKEKILPELDDDFAQDVSEFDTLEALKANAKEAIKTYREKEADELFLNALLEQVVDGMTVEVPEVLIESQVDMMVREQDMMMQQQGMSMEKFAEMTNQTMDAIRESAKPAAEKAVKLELALNEIAVKENIEVTAEDLDKEYEEMAKMYNMPVDDVKAAIKEVDLTSELKRRKAQDFVKENGVVGKKRKPAAKKAAQGEAEEKPAEEKKSAEKKPAAKKPAAKKTEGEAAEKKPAAKKPAAKKAEGETAEKKPAAKKTTKKTEETTKE